MASSILFPPTDSEPSGRLAVPLMRRLANIPGAQGQAIREQMERAAAAVPETQRPRVLGQLLARAAPDDQVRAAIGVLLLAKTLSDLGWQVEHEPNLDGLTPDLRITRNGTTYLVEVQRITHGRDEKAERMLFQVRDALVGLRTRSPLHLEAVHVPGGASLRRFRKHVEEVLAATPLKGRQVFEDGDVRIAYRMCPELPHEVGPILSMPIRATYGGAQDQIRKAVLTKLGRYRTPLIVALDLVDPTVSGVAP